jgi:hypothetical protein
MGVHRHCSQELLKIKSKEENNYKSKVGIKETKEEAKIYEKATNILVRPNVTTNDEISMMDSGASGHTFRNVEGLYYIKSPMIKKIVVGNGVTFQGLPMQSKVIN